MLLSTLGLLNALLVLHETRSQEINIFPASNKSCKDPDEFSLKLFVRSNIGGNCTLNIECSNQYFMRCFEGKCQCLEGLYPTSKYQCQHGPPVGAPCILGVCQHPYSCSTTNRCECPETMKKVYYGPNATCECADSLMRLGKLCLPRVKLNEECIDTRQCVNTFAKCQHGKCSCVNGTFDNDGICKPPEYRCPESTPLLDDESARISCKYNKAAYRLPMEQRIHIKLDTCPDGSFCNYLDSESKVGFCCPKPSNVKCPVGNAMDIGQVKNCLDKGPDRNCPSLSHYCYQYQVSHYSGALCCPRQCPPNFVEQDNQCFSVDPGLWATRIESGAMPCEVAIQCNYEGNAAFCNVETHRCQCNEGYEFGTTSQSRRWCIRKCDPNKGEIWHNNDCFSMRKQGETCKFPGHCDPTTFCDESTEQCQCRCDRTFNESSHNCEYSKPENVSVSTLSGQLPCMSDADCPTRMMCDLDKYCTDIPLINIID